MRSNTSKPPRRADDEKGWCRICHNTKTKKSIKFKSFRRTHGNNPIASKKHLAKIPAGADPTADWFIPDPESGLAKMCPTAPLAGYNVVTLAEVEFNSALNHCFSTNMTRMFNELPTRRNLFGFEKVTHDWQKPEAISTAFNKIAKKDLVYVLMVALAVRTNPMKLAAIGNAKRTSVNMSASRSHKFTTDRLHSFEQDLPSVIDLFPDLRLPPTPAIPEEVSTRVSSTRKIKKNKRMLAKPPSALFTVLHFLSTTYNEKYYERENGCTELRKAIRRADARFAYVANNRYGEPLRNRRGVVLYIDDADHMENIKTTHGGSRLYERGSEYTSYDLYALAHEATTRPVGRVHYIKRTPEVYPAHENFEKDEKGFLLYKGRRPAIVEITRTHWIPGGILRPGIYAHWEWEPTRDIFVRSCDGDVHVHIGHVHGQNGCKSKGYTGKTIIPIIEHIMKEMGGHTEDHTEDHTGDHMEEDQGKESDPNLEIVKGIVKEAVRTFLSKRARKFII